MKFLTKLFAMSKSLDKSKKTETPLMLRMGDKTYPTTSKPKGPETKLALVSKANKAFILEATFEKTTRQNQNNVKLLCYRVKCMETGRTFCLEKVIFDNLFETY